MSEVKQKLIDELKKNEPLHSYHKQFYLSGFLQYFKHFQIFFERVATSEEDTRMDLIAFNKTLIFNFPESYNIPFIPNNLQIMMLMMKDEDETFYSSPSPDYHFF